MEFSRILVRATNWVGDAVMCVPALEALRARYPKAHIAALARPWVAGLYGKELVDELIPYTTAKGWKELGAKRALAAELRGRNFDAAILLQNAFEAAALVWMAGIPVRIGYARDGRSALLTNRIAVPRTGEIPVHQRYYYLELLRRAQIISALPKVDQIRLPGLQRLRSEGRSLLNARGWDKPMVGISPGSAYGTAKRWLPERFAQSAVVLAQQLGAGVGVFGSPDETELCAAIVAQVQQAGVSASNFAGATSLAEFVQLAAAAEVFLTNDSGAMHIASALGVPTIAVFGATDHIATGPTGALARIIREPVDCSPYPSPCLLRECPIDHRCMKAVSSDKVAGEAWDLVQLRRQ